MARLGRDAKARGAVPVRTREASSAYVVSLTWWILFSMPPVAADAAGDLGCVGLLRGQVGHPVDAFQGGLVGGGHPSAAHDLEACTAGGNAIPATAAALIRRISSRLCAVARVLSRRGTSRHGRAFSHWCRVG